MPAVGSAGSKPRLQEPCPRQLRAVRRVLEPHQDGREPPVREDEEAGLILAYSRDGQRPDGQFQGLRDIKGANLGRSRLEYANLKDADLTGVVLMGSDLSGANLTGATVTGADFKNVDVSGARLIDLQGQSEAKDWAERVNIDRAVTQASD